MSQLEKDFQGVTILQVYDRIADIFMGQVIPVDLQIEKLYQSNEQLIQARDLLLPRLISGGVAV